MEPAVPGPDGTAPATSHERLPNDQYETPSELALAIAVAVDEIVGEFEVVIEPSAGSGAFVRAARVKWPKAYIQAVEIDPQFQGALHAAGADDVFIGPWEQWQETIPAGTRVLILGNPPYTLASDHVRIALQRMQRWGGDSKWMALLMRNAFLAGVDRYETIYGPQGLGGLRFVHNVVPRPSFAHGKTDAAEYTSFLWNAGYHGQYLGDWLRWR